MSQFPAPDSAWTSRLLQPYLLYAGLLRAADAEAGLGGQLLWAGELDENGCSLMRAANVAGAASLGASASRSALNYANREGVADFQVTSLDEALRILKNEVRKQQAVSVAVSEEPSALVAEMRERGVLPDLLPPPDWTGEKDLGWFLSHGSRPVKAEPLQEGSTFLAWSSAPPEFEARAGAALPEEDLLNRRWLRLSPRYLGPGARRVRSLACTAEVASRLTQAAAR